MDDAAWTTLAHEPRNFDWRAATAELSAARVELAALARTFPALPFTAGRVDAELKLADGALRGHARLRDGETRPLPGLGRMLGLEADLALQGRKVEVREFAAQLGGEPVHLTGTAELSARDRLRLDLRLEGRNVPLVRRPGLLVRTDLDLRAQTPDRGPTRISGTVDLRDALVLADLAAIIPGGPRGATRHPPYFAVTTEPFSHWPLDVRVGGARAVRVRTAVFNGVATPQFHLTGTLGEPRAVGQLAVDEGRVIFPFANFAVQQGAVRLTEADPTQPQLAVNATAKRMGYELRMEAGGTLASPTLTFSSNPPLESADILLLVTTGQPPADEANGPTGTQRLTRLGTFLGRGIFQNLTGSDEERLEITSGEQVSREGRETYRVEYKLRDKLSLTGEYDEYDSYNAGIKYRIYTQEGAKRDERRK
jgi:translocation and assembly module TamB